MSLYISSLNSGSNGNCYYLASEKDAILVDAGLNCRETEKRMHRLGLSMDKIRAVFVSHEHSDHINGLRTISGKYQLPVYITPGTLNGCRLLLEDHLVRNFYAHESVQIGELNITAFPKLHDAQEPHSFVVSSKKVTVGVFTDIGYPCENLIRYFKQCDAAFLESNYDDEMLDRGRYPYFLKNRIRGGKGHLSNKQAFELFRSYKSSSMTHLLLSHLSRDNNSPQLVSDLFKSCAGDTEIIVAARDFETGVYFITREKNAEPLKQLVKQQYLQYSLFDQQL